MAVTPQSAMNVNVAPGWVVVPAANNTGSVLCASDAVEVVGLATAPGAGNNRIDVVCATVASTDIGTAAGDTWSFTVVSSTAIPSPVAPTIPAGSVAIAQVLVTGGSASIVSANITDRRTPSNARDLLHARIYQNGAWNSAAASPVAMAFDSVDFDPGGMYSIPNHRFTAPVPGIYLLTSLVSVSYNGTNATEIQAWKNGANYFSAGSGSGNQSAYARIRSLLSTTIKAVAGDTFQVAFFTNPAALAGNVGPGDTFAAFDYLGTG
jgi:hypothetical protein